MTFVFKELSPRIEMSPTLILSRETKEHLYVHNSDQFFNEQRIKVFQRKKM